MFVSFAVHLLLEVVLDGLGGLGRRFEGHERNFLLGVGESVLVLQKIFVSQLTSPVDHAFVLSLPSLVLAVHLLVGAVVLEEASKVIRVLRNLGVTEEVEHFRHVFFDPSKLCLVVSIHVSVVFLSAILQVVGLSSTLAHSQDFLDTALTVGAGKVAFTQKELHHVLDLGLGVHDKILETDEENRDVTELGILHKLLHPAIDMSATVLDPPVKVLRVKFLVVEGTLDSVVVHVDKMEP